MACNYSTKFIPLIVSKAEAYGQNKENKPWDVEGFKNWLIGSFSGGIDVFTRYMSGALFNERSSTPTGKVFNHSYWGRFTQDTEYDAISDYFKGSDDLEIQSEHEFKTQIVKRLIFDSSVELQKDQWKNAAGINEETGASIVNEVIAKYKEELCNAILSEVDPEGDKVSLTHNLSDDQFNSIIQNALAKYRQFLSNNPENAVRYNEFVTLSLFDEYLKQYAPFVTPKPEFVNKVTNQIIKTDAFDKYEYHGPTVAHYTGFTSSEFAAIENQDSDLAKLLLDTIPDLNEEGQPIKGSFIGLSGFNAAMSAMKNWILYEAPIKVRKEYRKGFAADIDWIIEQYILRNKQLKDTTRNVYNDRTTFLNGKLRSIQNYIFGTHDDNIRSMFANMFFKTEPISYRTYSYDLDSKRVTGSNLRSTFINAQKFNVEDIVRSSIYLIKTSPSHKANLLNKYNLNYERGAIVVSKKSDPSQTVKLILDKKPNHYVEASFGDDSANLLNFKKDLIQDFLMFIIPDTYEQVGKSIEKSDWVWVNDFTPFVAAAAYALHGKASNRAVVFDNNLLDLKNYTDSTLRIAKKLSVIYGSETKNVVKNLSGSNLPLYQLTNLTYNLPNVIDDIILESTKDWSNPESEDFDPHWNEKKLANEQNLLVQARKQNKPLLIAPQVRQEVRVGGLTKAASSLTIKELLQLNVFNDFYQNLIDNTSPEYGKIYLQSATYADKSTHYLFGYDLNQNININGREVNLFKIISDIANGDTDSEQLLNIIRELRAARINNIVSNIIYDYNKVFKRDFKTIDDISAFLSGKQYDAVLNAFKAAGVKFLEEFHGTKPASNKKGIALNETMVTYFRTFNDSKLFKERIDKARKSFIKSIDENYWTWSKYDGDLFKRLYDKYDGFRGANGAINTHVGSTLHPILEAYFLSDVLLSNEVNSLLIGEVWAHPNKNKRATLTEEQYVQEKLKDPNFDEEIGTYEEFSEASRLIAQIKRSVAFGATYHPFIQDLDNGVPPEIRIAIIEDIKGTVFTPNGDENTKLDSSDGSGIAHPLQSRFENNSLVDARVHQNKKSIMMDVDLQYGKPTLLKWAVYELTNENRRNGILSRANLENIYKKMSDGLIEDFSEWEINSLIKERPLYYKDYKTQKYYQILSLEETEENWDNNEKALEKDPYHREITRYRIEIDPNTFEQTGSIISETIDFDTLYDYDQALGGAWTGEFKDGVWEYNERQLDILEELISDNLENSKKQSLYIGYLVNKSAIKVGAGNVNSTSSWNDDSKFETITMKTKYGGIQMDADHELDMAEVTEMTQMISALIEDGHYKDIVENIYKDIGGVVASHVAKLDSAVKEVLENGTPEAKQKLYEILAKSWISSFENKSKDTIGIAQAFVKKASESFRKGDFNTKVPFSAATINGSFISDVIASINKGGIRHKYEGFAGVLNPSHDMIQYFKVKKNGVWEVRLFDDLMKFIKENETWGIGFDDINKIYFDNVLQGTYLNPLLERVNPNEIDFEDTIVVLDQAGNVVTNPNDTLEPQFWYVNSFTTYDNLKSLLRKNPNYNVYIHTGKPRNLKATNVKFRVNDLEYSIYDLDSVRASQYLNRALGSDDYLNALSYEQLNIIKKALGWRFNPDVINASQDSVKKLMIANAIKACNRKTEDILKRIEAGQSFEASEAFGFTNASIDENGIPIQRDILHQELLKLGVQKDVDKDVLSRQLSDPSIASENQTVANWLLRVLQDRDELNKAPVILPKSILEDVHKAITLQKEADVLKENYQVYHKGSVSETAKAITNARDAINNVVERICNNIFDIDVNWVVRKILDAEPKQSLYVTASDYNVEAAEIITGRYQWEKFGLGDNDNIFDIKDRSYFYNRMQRKYNALPQFVESDLFDGVLFGNDEQFLFKIGQMPTEYTGNLSESTDFRVLEGNVYYQGIKVGSAQNKKFYTYVDETGKKHHIIQLNTADDFKQIKRSTLFDNVVRYNWNQNNLATLIGLKYEGDDEAKLYTNSKQFKIVNIADLTLQDLQTDESIRLEKRIDRQSKDMYDSFKAQLNYVGARIPTQAMQSFMAMKLIAVTNNKFNAVYVPKSQTYLEGSDYDIDKLYIMAYSVNSNGLVQTGTTIQSKYGLDFVSKLHRPEGKEITISETPEGATVLSQSFIENFEFNNLEESEIIDVYNNILETGKIYVEPYVNDGMIRSKHYQRVANTILKEVNSYSKSVLTSESDPNYLKNRVVSGIWAITNKLQNQLVSQVPVDMGDPQAAAQQSTLGRAELHINSDDPSAKMMMQQQNAVGKEVIGISAVSLKAFFGLYYYYSGLTEDLKQACASENVVDIVKALNKLVFTNPLNGKLTSLANIDIEQVIDVIKNNPNLKKITLNSFASLKESLQRTPFYDLETNTFDLFRFCKYLREEVNLTDAALTDSAVISAATDNAKELILAKINATPELVDIYTYLTAVGTPFLDIAEFMTSESFGFITKAGEVNIFDESSHKRKVKTALDWFLGKDLLPGTDFILLEQLLGQFDYNPDTNTTIHASKEKLIKALQNKSLVENALKRCYEYLEHPVTERHDPDRQGPDFYGKTLGINWIAESELKGVANILEWQLRAFEFKDSLKDPVKELSNLTKISNLLPNVKEMSIMGQAQGINQGQRTSLYANRSFIKRINDYVNTVFKENEMDQTFDFGQFVSDEDYKNNMIDLYEGVKKTFNILEALTKLPHFWEMLKTTNISKQAIKQSSWRSNTMWNLADNIESEGAWLSEDDWKVLDGYLNDSVIASFLKQNDIRFKIPPGTIYYSGMSMEGKLTNKVNGYEINLNTVAGIASFKRFMEDVVIPNLKSNFEFATNRFIANLIPYANISNDRIVTGWKLPLDMMNIDASPNTKLLFASILSDFDSISNQSIFGQKIGDLFYLYNLIVNKDGYGRSSFTRLFENTINSDDVNSLAYKFNDYISKLDSGDIQLEPDIDEAIYRIKRVNPDFRAKSNLSTYLKLPSDFTLDLPKFFDLPVQSGIIVSTSEMMQRTFDLGTSDAVYAIAQAIADRYDDSVGIVTDDDLANAPDNIKNAKAFIQNGKVWININSATAADALHELAHLVLASMKFSDDSMIRQTYYNLVSTMMDRSIVPEERFNNIVKQYIQEDGLVTSDILEEVLANEFAFYLSGELLGETPKLISTTVETNMLKAIAEILELKEAPLLTDIQGKSLTAIMQALGKNILNARSIDSRFTLRTQKVAKTEDLLYKQERLKCK